MKDVSCKGHKKENKLCYIKIKECGKIHHSSIVNAVADYNYKGELVGIEFYDGIPKNVQLEDKKWMKKK